MAFKLKESGETPGYSHCYCFMTLAQGALGPGLGLEDQGSVALGACKSGLQAMRRLGLAYRGAMVT